MNAITFATRNIQVTGQCGTGGKQYCVVIGNQLRDINGIFALTTNVCICDKINAFGTQDVDPPVDKALVEFHIRNAVHQKPADAIGPLINCDGVAGTI